MTTQVSVILLKCLHINLFHSLVCQNSEQQYLQVMSSDISEDTNYINRENAEFLLTPTISDQQLLYLQDTHMFLPISVSHFYKLTIMFFICNY